MIRLITLAGSEAIEAIPLKDLTPIDAAILTLATIAKEAPGITWGELADRPGQTMGKKWYEKFASWVGTGTSDLVGKIGEIGGSTIRLLTNKQVMDGVKSYAAAYATGGQSMSAEGLFQSLFGQSGSADQIAQLKTALASFGSQAQSGGGLDSIPKNYLLIGGIGLGALLLVMVLKK